jgi:hypothetical protein
MPRIKQPACRCTNPGDTTIAAEGVLIVSVVLMPFVVIGCWWLGGQAEATLIHLSTEFPWLGRGVHTLFGFLDIDIDIGTDPIARAFPHFMLGVLTLHVICLCVAGFLRLVSYIVAFTKGFGIKKAGAA